MAPSTTYRDTLTCDECGCFASRHDDLCSQWTEPSEPLDVDAPISYVLTDQGRSAITAAAVAELSDTHHDDHLRLAPAVGQRPDDQRFLSLAELASSVQSRRDLSRATDLRLDTLSLSHTADGDLRLASPDGQPIAFTNWSFGQLASLVGAPAAYLRKLPAPLARVNLEYGLELGDAGRESARLLYTPPVEGPDDGRVRAFTSTSYARIWDSQVVQAVEHINQDGRWTVPLQAYGGQNSKLATTLYASDRDVFLFLVDEQRPIDVAGQTYFRGFLTWNSEVGKAAFGLSSEAKSSPPVEPAVRPRSGQG